MECLQYVLYSLLSLRKDKVYVKGYQNNIQTPKIPARRDRTPGFEILGSATDLRLIPLCVESKLSPKNERRSPHLIKTTKFR